MAEYVTIRIPVVDAEPKWVDQDTAEHRVCVLCKHECYASDHHITSPKSDEVVVSETFGTVHVECYVKAIESEATTKAWFVVAREIAARPSKYTAAEVRATLTALARIALSGGESDGS